MNTWGRLLRLTTWGESHGEAIGGVLDGFPPGIVLDIDQVQHELERRAPGRSDLTSPRREPDKVHILSGVYEGKTTGAPIAIVIYNEDQRSRDYSELARLFRPGHADYTYQMKYGHRDPRGGGRASARETAIRVAAGAIVRQWLQGLGVEIVAYTTQVGSATCDDASTSWSDIYAQRHTPLRCPDPEAEEEMQALIRSARDEGDSVGGIVVCRAIGIPVGLGEPLYDKLSARLAYAMMSINAVRGFEIGDGFALGGDVWFAEQRPLTPRPLDDYGGGLLLQPLRRHPRGYLHRGRTAHAPSGQAHALHPGTSDDRRYRGAGDEPHHHRAPRPMYRPPRLARHRGHVCPYPRGYAPAGSAPRPLAPKAYKGSLPQPPSRAQCSPG